MSSQESSLLRLRVVADADPGVLARILERFQNLNMLPRRVIAELGPTGTCHIQVDLTGLSENTLTAISAKLGQVPSIRSAYWHRA
jgi:hypothetical protein